MDGTCFGIILCIILLFINNRKLHKEIQGLRENTNQLRRESEKRVVAVVNTKNNELLKYLRKELGVLFESNIKTIARLLDKRDEQ